MPLNIYQYVVLSRKQETPTVTTLLISNIEGEIPKYIPGQHITIYFYDINQTLGKQYSISSAPNESNCTISVRAMGKFSNRLCSLQPGDTISSSLPQGTFRPKQKTKNIIMIAGGMGVTSFRGIIFYNIKKNKQIYLLYSSKKYEDTPFKEQFLALSQNNNFFKIRYFITQETGTDSEDIKYRRIEKTDFFKKQFEETVYLLSGSLSFVLYFKNTLIEEGVSKDKIKTESYFFN